jgi:DMSO/TMAO reductase YedYZ heme-binding membrane subunit
VNPQLWWYLARATGYVAWALLAASVVSGLLLSTRLTNGRPSPAWILDLHRFLAGTGVIFTGLHLAGLVADDYLHFGVAELLVPFASTWRTVAVALGVVALYLLVAVEVSSLLMRRLPRRLWRGIHLASYVAFWLATFHLVTAGTDAAHPWSMIVTALVITGVVFLTLVRSLGGRGGGRRAGARVDRPLRPDADRREQHAERDQEAPEGTPGHADAGDPSGQTAAEEAAGKLTGEQRGGHAPIDVAEGPVRGEGGDGEGGDHEQAGADRRAHPEPEHQQVHGHQDEGAAVGEQAGEQPDHERRGDQQRAVPAASGAGLAGGLGDG